MLLGMKSVDAQNLSNINVQQQDTVIYVLYDLQQKSDIDLYVSLNDGKSFLGPMQYVSGDVGHNVRPGKNKVVFWYAVSEMGYVSNPGVKFKIVAKSSKDSYLENMNMQYVSVASAKPFDVGKTEVTVYQYAQFVENTGYVTTAELAGYSYVWNEKQWVKTEGVNWRTNNKGKVIGIEDSQKQPVLHLSYKDVLAFCDWAGCRLPSKQEWKETSQLKTAKKDKSIGIIDLNEDTKEWCSDKVGNGYVFGEGTDASRSNITNSSCSLIGFRAVKASSKDEPLPVIVIKDKENAEPIFVEKRDNKKRNFLTINVAGSIAPELSFGLTYARCGRYGWYVSAMSGIDFQGFSTDVECNGYGYVNSHFPVYDGTKATNRISVNAGAMLRLSKKCYYRLGIGYGIRNLNWKTQNDLWVRNKEYSGKGIEFTTGFMFDFKGFVLSADAVYTRYHNLEGKIGLGFSF